MLTTAEMETDPEGGLCEERRAVCGTERSQQRVRRRRRTVAKE